MHAHAPASGSWLGNGGPAAFSHDCWHITPTLNASHSTPPACHRPCLPCCSGCPPIVGAVDLDSIAVPYEPADLNNPDVPGVPIRAVTLPYSDPSTPTANYKTCPDNSECYLGECAPAAAVPSPSDDAGAGAAPHIPPPMLVLLSVSGGGPS